MFLRIVSVAAFMLASMSAIYGASISDAKLLVDSSSVNLEAKVVTYASTGVSTSTSFFYVEEDSRNAGIRVVKTTHGMTVGMRADVSGTMRTNTNGERYILATSAEQTDSPNDTGTIAPVALNNKSLCGGDWSVAGTAGQRGVLGGVGLNSIGLLVRTWGVFQQLDATTFTLDDGTGYSVKCTAPSGLSLYSEWEHVAVTGVSSLYKVSSLYPPNILVRDIDVVVPAEVISVPGPPVGNTSPAGCTDYEYSTTGSTSGWEHQLEYRFSWGDGSFSAWSDGKTASHQWCIGETYCITVEARCKLHHNATATSDPVCVHVRVEEVSVPGPPTGPSTGNTNPAGSHEYSTTGSTSNWADLVEYSFDWGDGTSSPWSELKKASHKWCVAGTYTITVTARCKIHPGTTSQPSTGLVIIVPAETISVPGVPTGNASHVGTVSYTYSTTGSTSNWGDTIKYSFDWGDATSSGSSTSTTASHGWNAPGAYCVKVTASCQADASCSTHTVVTAASGCLTVTVLPESITVPGAPTGKANPIPGENATYSTTGSTSNWGDTIEYSFNWGDGTSPSTPNISKSAQHSWANPGQYLVTVTASCQSHTSVSVTSGSLTVTVPVESVTVPGTPTGKANPIPGENATYSTTGSTSNYGHPVQYVFHWGDAASSGSSTSTSASHSWSAEGTYYVTVTASCQSHTIATATSPSPGLAVIVPPELFAAPPGAPTGNTAPGVGVTNTYSTTGSPSNYGHTVEYSFDWGETPPSSSPWSTSTNASHKWITAGPYTVTVRARCQAHRSVESLASTGLAITATVYTLDGPMVSIPAGSFDMGTPDDYTESHNADEHPQHSVALSGYSIGTYEVTRGDYGKFMLAGGYSDSAFWSTNGWTWKASRTQPTYWAASENWGTPPGAFTQTVNYPVVGVSYYEAEAFCNWAAGHLPTEAQWERAARWGAAASHPNIYPWGDTFVDANCNHWSDILYPGSQTAPVGSYPSGASPSGCQDMAGNVWEWCKDWYGSTYYSPGPVSDPQGPASGAYRVNRGGSWASGGYGGSKRCAERSWDSPSTNNYYTGFRLAR